jgi:hypothetical protein
MNNELRKALNALASGGHAEPLPELQRHVCVNESARITLCGHTVTQQFDDYANHRIVIDDKLASEWKGYRTPTVYKLHCLVFVGITEYYATQCVRAFGCATTAQATEAYEIISSL